MKWNGIYEESGRNDERWGKLKIHHNMIWIMRVKRDERSSKNLKYFSNVKTSSSHRRHKFTNSRMCMVYVFVIYFFTCSALKWESSSSNDSETCELSSHFSYLIPLNSHSTIARYINMNIQRNWNHKPQNAINLNYPLRKKRVYIHDKFLSLLSRGIFFVVFVFAAPRDKRKLFNYSHS